MHELSESTIKHLTETVCWLVREAKAGRKTMAEADAYYADVKRLIEQSEAAKAGN